LQDESLPSTSQHRTQSCKEQQQRRLGNKGRGKGGEKPPVATDEWLRKLEAESRRDDDEENETGAGKLGNGGQRSGSTRRGKKGVNGRRRDDGMMGEGRGGIFQKRYDSF